MAWLAAATAAALALAGALLAALGQASVAQAQPMEAGPSAANPSSIAAPSAIIPVTNTNDSGAGSLRRAMNIANLLSPGPDTITFELDGCPCVITLLSELPVITEALRIMGPGADLLAVDGNGSVRVFDSEFVPVRLSDLTVQNGYGAGTGGGIRSDGPLTLTNVNVLSNTATGQGGGVYAGAETVLVGGEIRNNASTGNDAGGVLVDDTLMVSGTAFISNTAAGYGGAIFGDILIVDGGLIERNHSDGEGGAIYVNTLTLTDTLVISNTANAYGGGAYGAETWLYGGQFVGNVAGGDAGGLGSGPMVISGTAFINNIASDTGGGIYGEGAALIHGAHFEGNQAGTRGGGLTTYAPLTITASAFVNNAAEIGGGLHGDTGSLTNVLFAGNVASGTNTQVGSAIDVSTAGAMHLAHLTVVGSAVPTGTAVVVHNGAVYITNTIIGDYAVGIEQQSGTVSQDHSLFFNVISQTLGTVSSSNVITGDPGFADPGAGNYHLGLTSDALDAGADAGVTTDYDGDARPQGSGFDIGFDEASFITGLAIDHSPEPALPGETVSFTATITGGLGVTYTWNFGDSTPPAVGNPITHTYAAGGVYDVSVTAANAGHSVVTSTQVSVVAPLRWLYLPLVVR